MVKVVRGTDYTVERGFGSVPKATGGGRHPHTVTVFAVMFMKRGKIRAREALVTKRVTDIVLSLLGIVLASPLLLLAGIAVVVESGFPVLFRQQRVGRNFELFTIYKLRTMKGPEPLDQFVLAEDSRITKVGKVLRKTKLDELPQLVNVLRGDMSLVGPRPELPWYVDKFRDDYAELLTIRPGITDPASLKYRHEADILATYPDPQAAYVEIILPDKINLARDYVRRSSLALDTTILVRTVVSLLQGNRA